MRTDHKLKPFYHHYQKRQDHFLLLRLVSVDELNIIINRMSGHACAIERIDFLLTVYNEFHSSSQVIVEMEQEMTVAVVTPN